jgi:D-alanyl-D-alanine dipeptidase
MNNRLEKILRRSKDEIIGEKELSKIPIKECGEPLLEIKKVVPSVIIKMRPEREQFAGGQMPYARETICEMLAKTRQLLSEEYRLVIFDAYRPLEYQKMRFNMVFQKYKERFPEKSDDEIRAMVFVYVFPPCEDPKKPPAHSTGGAVDISIASHDCVLIDMGCDYGVFDERTYTNSKMIEPKHKVNREILIKTMVEVGFCNYPGEWWHFMYGDREYAAYEGLPYAIYGRAELNSVQGHEVQLM